MIGFVLLLSMIGVVAGAFNASVTGSQEKLTGTIVGARFACLGLWCPQWSLEVTRYDPIRYIDTPYTFDLINLLPLGPTKERSGMVRTAYDAATRILTVAAADYPETGVDAVWTVKVSPDVTTAEAVSINVLFQHPDASVNNPGSIHLSRLIAAPDGRSIAIFSCGSIFDMDMATGTYTKIGDLYNGSEHAGWTVTDAHTIEGHSMKSFVKAPGTNSESFLVVTDLSAGVNQPAAVKTMVQVARPQGMNGLETPQNAHMFTKPDETSPRIMMTTTGNFDYMGLVDETTGAIELAISNLADSTSQVDLQCFEGTKECDLWQTSCVDPISGSIFFQAHDVNADSETTVVSVMQYTTSKIDPNPYALSWITIEPMIFGFNGYQWVDFQ